MQATIIGGKQCNVFKSHLQLGHRQHNRKIAPQRNPKAGLRAAPMCWLQNDRGEPTLQSKTTKQTAAWGLNEQLSGVSLVSLCLTRACTARGLKKTPNVAQINYVCAHTEIDQGF